MVLGDVTKVFNAQNVLLECGAGNDELITLYNITKSKVHPRQRTNTRIGAIDFYSYPLISVTFEAVVTKAVYDFFATANTLDARSNLPQTSFKVIGQNADGSSGDDMEADFTAAVPELTDLAGENGNYIIRATLIILNSSYSSS